MRTMLFLLCFAFIGCADAKKEPNADGTNSEGRIEVTAAKYGDKWPLTVDRAEIASENGGVYLYANNTRYPLNGLAKGHARAEANGGAIPDVDDIWRRDTSEYGTLEKVTDPGFIELGLSIK